MQACQFSVSSDYFDYFQASSGRGQKSGHHMNHIRTHSLSIHATGAHLACEELKFGICDLAAYWVSRSQAFDRFPIRLLHTDVARYALIERVRRATCPAPTLDKNRRDHRTNNLCDGGNNTFIRLVGHSHPTTWNCIVALQNDEICSRRLVIQFEKCKEKPHQYSAVDSTVDAMLHHLCPRYRNGEISRNYFQIPRQLFVFRAYVLPQY